MRTITDIYKYYKIPDNLQIHMFRAAGSAELLINHWRGPAIEPISIIRVLLLHDIGNISKSNFDLFPPSLVGENHSLGEWKKIQEEFIEKFGKDDHVASYLVGKEVGLTEAELKLMNAKIFIKNDIIAKQTDYNIKIAAYVDQRVAPSGILPLLDRLLEAKERYKNVPGSSMNNPKTEILINYALEIEKQVMQHCTIKPEDINDESVQAIIEKLRIYQI